MTQKLHRSGAGLASTWWLFRGLWPSPKGNQGGEAWVRWCFPVKSIFTGMNSQQVLPMWKTTSQEGAQHFQGVWSTKPMPRPMPESFTDLLSNVLRWSGVWPAHPGSRSLWEKSGLEIGWKMRVTGQFPETDTGAPPSRCGSARTSRRWGWWCFRVLIFIGALCAFVPSEYGVKEYGCFLFLFCPSFHLFLIPSYNNDINKNVFRALTLFWF